MNKLMIRRGNLSLEAGSEVGEFQDLPSMLAGKSLRRFSVLECKHARSATVEVSFERLVVFTHRGMMLEAGVHIAIPDHVAVLEIHRVITEEVHRLNHLNAPPRLLVF